MNNSKHYIKLGIAYEGTLDTGFVTALMDRLLDELGFGTSEMDIVQARTVVTKFVPVYLKRFGDKSCDLMVFLTDGDNGTNTKRDIVEKIESTHPEALTSCVIGIPEPHLERWIIADEDTVKSVFNLDGAKALPFPTMKPKDRLISICSSSEYTGTLDDAKVTIANCANIQAMTRRCSDFASFMEDLRTSLSRIKS